MIHDLIILTLCISFWCCGLFCITEKGKIFYFIRAFFERTKEINEVLTKNGVKEYVIPFWISNPCISCISCMASVHGILMFMVLLSYDVIEFNLMTLVLGCIMASFIQTLLWSIFENLRIKSFYFQNKTNGS